MERRRARSPPRTARSPSRTAGATRCACARTRWATTRAARPRRRRVGGRRPPRRVARDRARGGRRAPMGAPIVGGGDVNATGFCLVGRGGRELQMGRRRRRADDARPRRRRRHLPRSAPPHPPTPPAPSPSRRRCRRPGRRARFRRTATAGCGDEYYSLALGGVRPAAVPLGGGRLRVAVAVGASASLRAAIRDGHGRARS